MYQKAKSMNSYEWSEFVGEQIPFLALGLGMRLTTGIRTGESITNTADIGKVLSYTKSNLKKGQHMHKLYKSKLHNPAKKLYKEFNQIKGIRPDFVDFNTSTIYEFKPNNPRAIKYGYKQLERNRKEFEKHYGGNWNIVLDTY